MFHNLRRRAESEKGFTLIELLVVILIIGILAAIAIPAFLNQRSKAYDANAKSTVRTAQTAEEAYATDNNGSYGALTDLVSIEPTLSQAGTNLTVTPNGSTGYTLTDTASGPAGSPDTFTITDTSGNVSRTCTGTNGGCPASKSW